MTFISEGMALAQGKLSLWIRDVRTGRGYAKEIFIFKDTDNEAWVAKPAVIEFVPIAQNAVPNAPTFVLMERDLQDLRTQVSIDGTSPLEQLVGKKNKDDLREYLATVKEYADRLLKIVERK